MKKTKILATLGPSSNNRETLEAMVGAGLNGVRINLSHGSIEQYDKTIALVRSLAPIADLPIIFDTQGPETRIATQGNISVSAGQQIRIYLGASGYPHFTNDLVDNIVPGENLFIDDGKIRFTVKENTGSYAVLDALTTGTIRNNKRVNAPSVALDAYVLTDRDKLMIEFGKRQGVDYVALSYARTADDVLYLRDLLSGSGIGIIPKIENMPGVENIDEILAVSDGVMVARGDLGVEVPYEKLPGIQKEIIRKANMRGILSITATQMLESMIDEPIPRRSESTDVYNAILDGSDVVMLSGETATGKYPVEVVETMSKIAVEAEKGVRAPFTVNGPRYVSDAITNALYHAAMHCTGEEQDFMIDKIITLTETGYTARMASRGRLQQPIIAVTADPKVRRRLELYYGVTPVLFEGGATWQNLTSYTNHLFKQGLVSPEDVLIYTGGTHVPGGHVTNTMGVYSCSDLLSE